MKKLKNTRQCVGNFLMSFLLILPLAARSLTLEVPSELKKEYDCMVLNLHHEARGEKTTGMIAVANVVLNRVKHRKFPNNVCSVVYQKHQFSWVKDKRIKRVTPDKASDKAKLIAYEAIVNQSLKDKTRGSLYFKTKTARFSWLNPEKPQVVRVAAIGNHEFFVYR
jgi:spore germination cell wall hydrolase CwlJ-like protein